MTDAHTPRPPGVKTVQNLDSRVERLANATQLPWWKNILSDRVRILALTQSPQYARRLGGVYSEYPNDDTVDRCSADASLESSSTSGYVVPTISQSPTLG